MTDSIDGIKRVIVWPPTQRSCSYRLLNWFSAVNSAINWSYSLEANSFAMVKEKEKKKKTSGVFLFWPNIAYVLNA